MEAWSHVPAAPSLQKQRGTFGLGQLGVADLHFFKYINCKASGWIGVPRKPVYPWSVNAGTMLSDEGADGVAQAGARGFRGALHLGVFRLTPGEAPPGSAAVTNSAVRSRVSRSS